MPWPSSTLPQSERRREMSGQWIRPSRVSYWVAGTLPAGTPQSPPRPARRARFTNTASGIAVNASARLSTCDSASLAGPIFSDAGSAGDDASAGTAPLRRSGSVGTSRSIGVVPACQSTSIARDSLVRIRTNTDKRSTCRGPALNLGCCPPSHRARTLAHCGPGHCGPACLCHRRPDSSRRGDRRHMAAHQAAENRKHRTGRGREGETNPRGRRTAGITTAQPAPRLSER
jgi:hypothetical protein